jgi:hypothetical protein
MGFEDGKGEADAGHAQHVKLFPDRVEVRTVVGDRLALPKLGLPQCILTHRA